MDLPGVGPSPTPRTRPECSRPSTCVHASLVKELENFLVLFDDLQVNALGHYIHTTVEVKTGM